jgi:hypothetical protein
VATLHMVEEEVADGVEHAVFDTNCIRIMGQVTATAGRFSDSNPGPPWAVIIGCKQFV